MKLSEHAITAIRYYLGDVEGNDPFWGDRKAYCTLNALFFPGIANETARAREGKRLNPAFLQDIGRLTALCTDLLQAFCDAGTPREITVFRVERLSDCLLRRELGDTISFTSTSASGFLKEYRDKKGLALLRFRIPAGTPCIVMADVLDHYAKAQEDEVLLPPQTELEFTEIPLSEEERQITDADGNPPAVSFFVNVCGMRSVRPDGGCLPAEGAGAGQRVYEALNRGEIPAEEDVRLYCEWKEVFRKNVLSGIRTN